MTQVDRYVYPGTNILRNRFGIEDALEAEAMERQVVGLGMARLRLRGIVGEFDVWHLVLIHKMLFEEMYEWAGEFRDIRMWKGGTEFAEPANIRRDVETVCRGIRRRDFYRGRSFDEVAFGLAWTLAELDMAHPFRDGNGRTQRAFVEQLALAAGWELDLFKLSEDAMRMDSMAAARGNFMPLQSDIRMNLHRPKQG